jgi:nitrogen regulatory protein P-II 1
LKKIEAIVKPFKLDDVKEALNDIGVTGMTIVEVKGYGRQQGHTELYRGSEYIIDFIPKIKITIVAKQENVDKILETISDAAKTGKIGDGKIFVSNIDKVLRIRTGELDNEAL